jgi:hypothetical protein
VRFHIDRLAERGPLLDEPHTRLGVSLCDDVGGVARPGRAVRRRLSC